MFLRCFLFKVLLDTGKGTCPDVPDQTRSDASLSCLVMLARQCLVMEYTMLLARPLVLRQTRQG